MASPAPAGAGQPRFEVAEILREHAQQLRLSPAQARVVRDITSCRTPALGGHLESCPGCGFFRLSYNSCRNRHCPKCQRLKQALWAEQQLLILPPTAHFQLVFTLPAQLQPLFRRAPRLCLDLFFAVVAQTLTAVAFAKLEATIGFTLVLHTWNQKLGFHPHLHCLVPAGALSHDGARWIATSRRFFLPVQQLRKLFRGKLLAGLQHALRAGEIPGDLAADLLLLRRTPKQWHVFAKPPLAGPEHVVNYLSRYVHRIAIANSRILDYDGTHVSFSYKDRARGKRERCTLEAAVFARRFLQHVLPPRFVRIRHYGLLATRKRADLERVHRLLRVEPRPVPHDADWAAAFERLFGTNPLLCPACHVAVLLRRPLRAPLRR